MRSRALSSAVALAGVAALGAVRSRRRCRTARCARAAAAHRAPACLASRVRMPSRNRIGCARRRRSSARSASRRTCGSCRRWCEPPDPTARQPRARSRGSRSAPASHPTTRLCLEWLRADVAPGEAVLDYGCGSGILAIAAAQLGARARRRHRHRSASAVAASAANARANGVDARFAAPDALPQGAFDIVVANILSESADRCSRRRSRRACTRRAHRARGILEAQADAVVGALCARGLTSRPGALPRAGCCLRACVTRARATTRPRATRWPTENYTRCPGCRTVFRVTPAAARAARRAGALRPLPRRCSTARRTCFRSPRRCPASADADELALGPATVTLRSARALEPAPPEPGLAHREPSFRSAADRKTDSDAKGERHPRRFVWNPSDVAQARLRKRVYAAAIPLLAVLLAGQALFHYRDAIASRWPGDQARADADMRRRGVRRFDRCAMLGA